MGAKQVDYSLLASARAGISGFEAAEVNTPEYDLVVIGSGPARVRRVLASPRRRRARASP